MRRKGGRGYSNGLELGLVGSVLVVGPCLFDGFEGAGMVCVVDHQSWIARMVAKMHCSRLSIFREGRQVRSGEMWEPVATSYGILSDCFLKAKRIYKLYERIAMKSLGRGAPWERGMTKRPDLFFVSSSVEDNGRIRD